MYYIIPELQKSFITNGSTISWLNKTNIRNFNIPIPKSEEKIKEWVDKISKPYDEKNKQLYNQLIKELVEEAILTNTDKVISEVTEVPNTTTVTAIVSPTASATASTTSSTSSIKSLHEQCKSLGIKGYSKYKNVDDKDKLLKLIMEHK